MTRQMWVDSHTGFLFGISLCMSVDTTRRDDTIARTDRIEMDDVAVLKFKNQQLGGQVRAMARTNERTTTRMKWM